MIFRSARTRLFRIWRRNTWLPTVREYAWRVLTGTAFAAASMIGRPLVERWQCNCNFCDVDVLDTMDHKADVLAYFNLGGLGHAPA